MQKLISKYGLAAHLALVAVAPLFLPLSAVIWLSVLGAVWLVMEPSRFGDELLHNARRRVVKALVSDPLFWVLLVLVGVVVLRMLNTGVAMIYDAEAGKWLLSEPALPLLPGSVEGGSAPLVGCAVALFVILPASRHCMGRSSRGAFALLASALSGIGAYVLLIGEWVSPLTASAVSTDASWLSDPCFSGVAYGGFLLCAVVSLVSAFEMRWLKVMPLTIVGISGNLLGLVLLAPVTVAAAHLAAALVVLLYSFVYLRLRLGQAAEFKFLVFFGMGVVLFVLATQWLSPGAFSEERLSPLLSGRFVPECYVELRNALSDVSARTWKAHPWLGCGYGSFPLALQFNVSPEGWTVIPPFQKSALNGYWMILAERGVVGAFLLAVPSALLVITYVRRLVKGVTLSLPHPMAWAGFLLAVVASLEMLVDTSYLAPGATVALVSVFALSAAAFPKEMRSNGR